MKRLPAMTAALLLLPAAAEASFPGANGRIAFNWTFGCDGSMIASMKADGSDRRVLTADACVEEGPPRAAFPDWTADGRTMLFRLGTRLAAMNADGSGQQPLTIATTDGRPSVSPDGTRVAFTRIFRNRQWVYTADLDGGDRRRLHPGYSPRWSPNGRRIAYADGANARVTIIRAGDGAIVRRLNAFAGALDWAPGGRRLVFTRFDDLFVTRADGRGGVRRLTRTSRGELSPVWSPNGRRIAFVRTLSSGEEEIRFGVFTMPARGGAATRIFRTDEESIEETLEPLTISWQPR